MKADIEKIRAWQQRSRKPLKRSPMKRTVTKAAKKRRKKGEWSSKTADINFSLFIRARDGKCLRCGTTENLTCSHYFRRGVSATRYNEENCDTLCLYCHTEWEGPKKDYTAWKIKQMGQNKFLALSLLAGTTVKRVNAVAECKRLLGK